MTSNDREPIAIVGTGCRFPGNSSSPSKLWELLKEPRDVQTEIPKERFNPAGFYHPNGMHHASTNVRRSYLLSEDHRLFDAQFFNIHPMEANAMDPQQRILLETVYEATESAGLPLEKLRGSDTAVFIGLMNEEYSTHLLRDPDSTPMYIGTGTARSLVSNRISYFYDWHGPSMTIDTACSSSLVSMHQAVQSLRSLESRVAVVGGTNLIISPEPFISESKLKMLSPGGRSRMWDINADGYARGDGVAAIVLKRLSDALRDGDSIECIIRETGVNQDGKTKGITMPSPISQMELIRSTYERAGLDPFKDRPQYFEAHGTGTPAGDPVEAEAIRRSFFDSDSNSGTRAEIPLYVGSIKTVIGHTEGTAGLAGIIKASLALKHGTIPPNMLLRTLSPAVEPFYGNLKIVSKSTAWPPITIGQSRRASVNSFGFGGTNAHAILESYQDSIAGPHPQQLQLPIPFVFSAASEKALSAMLVNHADYLKTKPDVDLHDLAYTLRERRSTLPVRAAISASTTTELVEKMSVPPTQSGGSAPKVVRGGASAPHILGIFTGQGAQWAGMGRELLLQSKFVESIITSLDSILKNLPQPFRPSWSLKDELLADSSASRLSEAAISQPICTAIQIVLVDILRSSGVKLQAVVGHSSGEIGAAYASGFISAADAIKIAYYRGFHAQRASSPNGNQVRGAMMAVGTSVIDATELCEHLDMEGRICVAACNSSSSVTLSGDADAVEEAKEIFDDEKKFARILKVDTAYHSPHMLACSDHYFQSLKQSSIGTKTPGNVTTWISSVEAGKAMSASSDVTEAYWVENMTKPVLFMQAVKAALAHSGPFNMAIEIGPHPALKGPALQSIQESTGIEIPYLSLLSRAKNAAHTTSDALGSLWCHFGGKGLDLSRSNTTLTGYKTVPRLLKDLPIYAWDHDKAFWFESRISKTYRTHSREIHHLLGTQSLDNTENRICWKNLLRLSEMPWLQGHQLQHQVIFPAAGYVVTAFEAAVVLAKHHPIQLLEVEDLTIEKSITFDENDSGVEVAIALTDIIRGAKHITAHFSYHAGLGKDPEKLTLISNCLVKIVLGEHASLALPEKSGIPPNLANIDSEIFYTSLEKLGYQYTGAFRALTQLRRKLNIGTCEIINEPLSDWSKQLLIHPAMLDATFQSLFLASSHPGDGTLQELHVPVSIQRIRINPHFRDALSIEQSFSLDCRLRPRISSRITGDVDIFTPGGGQGVVQVEGITVVPLASSTPAQDRPLFSQFIWGAASPDGVAVSQSHRSTPEEFEFQLVAEQVALYYLNKVIGEITEAEWAAADWHFAHMRNFARVSIAAVQSGEQPFTERHWMENTREQVFVMMEKYPGRVELQIMKAVGENLAAAIRGETNILEHMIDGNALTRFYEEETGIECLTLSLARTAKQLTFRYPHMKILEIGAGTGGATKKVMQHIGDAFTSYTFTDISAGFFEKAQEVFKDHATGMDFKVLDIEKDIVEQGYTPHSYDMVIASLVLHATQNMERTMKNVRRLLKPGGFVLMLELTAKGPMKMAFVFCGLPGWWLGVSDGRKLSPNLSSTEWHSCLRNTGFSGVDMITPEDDFLIRPGFVITSQATDDRIKALRAPLDYKLPNTTWKELIILGGSSLQVSCLSDRLGDILRSQSSSITYAKTLDQLNGRTISPSSTVLSIIDLDNPVFKSITSSQLEGLKYMLGQARLVLWVTRGCRCDDPYANIMVGFGRTLSEEMGHIRFQHLDIDPTVPFQASIIAETLVQTHLLELWEEDRRNGKLFWSLEPELAQDQGQLCVTRLLPNVAANDRYNSLRREIQNQVNLQASPVELKYLENSFGLVRGRAITDSDKSPSQDFVRIRVSHSLLHSVYLSTDESYFLVIGHETTSGRYVVGLSTELASTVDISKDLAWSIENPHGREDALLRHLATQLIAHTILANLSPGSTVLIHEPDIQLATILSEKQKENNINVKFTTTQRFLAEDNPDSWIILHPASSRQVAKRMIPENVTLFIDLTNDGAPEFISKCLPPHCKRIEKSKVFGRTAYGGMNPSKHLPLVDSLRASESSLNVVLDSAFQTWPLISLMDVPKISSNIKAIIDWTATPTVPIKVRPVDSENLFSDNKTYILFGLTGDLGQSLCDWMVTKGARYIVLTSRNPKIEPSWIDSLRHLSAHVKVFSNDITDRVSLSTLCREIRATLPPVGGIANGAMFLRDVMIPDMDIDVLNSTLGPKVNGAKYLNELFPEADLEFCIFFSSVAAIWGNRGQASYSGANMYATSLVRQRRKLGLPASIIHIGPILGAGYVSNASQKLRDSLDKAGWVFSSESDFHQAFAEAIVAGRPDSGLCPDIVFGMRRTTIDPGTDVQWFDNPKFQHCGIQNKRMETSADSKSATTSSKDMLLSAASRDEAYKIIQDALVAKLQAVLQLELVDDEKAKTLVAKGADELGMDSLVAVQVRSWILKEFSVDVQVLKLLGGATIQEIIEYVLEKIPEEMVPHMNHSTPSTSSIQEVVPTIITQVISSPLKSEDSNSEHESLEGSRVGDEKLTDSTNWSSSEFENTETPCTTDLIPRRSTEMGYGQARFWALRSLLEDKTTFNITCSARLSGRVRVSDLEKAVTEVCQRHEAFRTIFYEDEKQNYLQAIIETSLVNLEAKMVSSEAEIDDEFRSLNEHVFDLEHGETFKIMLLSLSSTSHVLAFSYDHIIMDGVSLEIFLSDLIAVYEGRSPESDVYQYYDFSVKEREKFQTRAAIKDLSFWQQEFVDIPPPLPLFPFTTTQSRMMLSTYKFSKVEIKLDATVASKIKAVCQRNKSTPFHFHLAVLKTLLFRLLDIDDLSIGIADANRVDNESLHSVGMYLNLLPLRFRRAENQPFKQGLKEARSKAYAAMLHGSVPFNILLEELNVPRSARYSPIFQAFLNYRQGVEEKRRFGECDAEGLKYEIARSAYDLALDIIDNPGGFSTIALMVQKSLYSVQDAQFLLDCYVRLLQGFSTDEHILETEAAVFSEERIQQACEIGRGPLVPSTWGETLCHQVARFAHGENLAIKDGMGTSLTHKQMAIRVSKIASRLVQLNVSVGSIVAALQLATVDWVCSLLAIWTVGAVYVPLDVRIPNQRLESIIEDSYPIVILSHSETNDRAKQLRTKDATVIDVSAIPKETPDVVSLMVHIKSTSGGTAAIFFTSGSTGAPKGIVLKHSGFINEIEGTIRTCKLPPAYVLQQSALGFDMSVWQVFMGLANGGSVYVASQSERGDPLALSSLIEREGITLTGATPSEYSSWLHFGSWVGAQSWRTAFCGGEVMTQAILKQFRELEAPDLHVFNWYGPTEVSFSNNKTEIQYKQESPRDCTIFSVGLTSPNCTTYIVDDRMNLLPAGFSGEILIGGAGVGLGYLNNSDLTQKVFIEDRFSPPEYLSQGWTKLHRTGDRGRMRPDGALVIEGRIKGDTQIKLRGIRIDMQDIEAVLLSSAGDPITDAAVILKKDSQLLVAFVVFSPRFATERQDSFLAKLSRSLPLPQYMQPAFIIPVDSLPMTTTGKLDRKALQLLQITTAQHPIETFGLTDIEHQLRQVWQKVLGQDASDFHMIDKYSNFFYVGGNSALLVRLQILIRETFNVALPLFELFEASTLDALASKISSSAPVNDIDWVHETSLALPFHSEYRLPENEVLAAKSPSGRTIVVTGASGYLGKSILRELIQDPHVSTIHCLAVRLAADSSESGVRDLGITSEKIQQHAGNLSDPLLGVSQPIFDELSRQADLIIHCGAQRSFWGHYQLFRSGNVLSTKDIVKMASARKTPIHFVSSGGVLLFDEEKDNSSERSMKGYPPPTDGSNGYLASKWASEQILENAANTFGIPVRIFRTLPTRKGMEQSSMVVLEQFLSFANELRALPAADGWTAEFDLLPVTKLAHAICDCSDLSSNDEKVNFAHYNAEVKLTSGEVAKYLETQCENKDDFKRMHATEWMGAIKKMGFGYLFAAQKMELDTAEGWNDALVSQR